MKLSWKRLLWVLFVCLYSVLFFYNCLKPFGNWLLPYIYTMVLVIWLAYEYYRKNLFFQSGSIPDNLYFWLPRALFALFFYSSFVIGIATIIWWPANKIGLYPVINVIGLCILLASIYLRWKMSNRRNPARDSIRNFYLSIVLLIISLPLGYGSFFLIGYVIIIGLPLTYWNYMQEKRAVTGFEDYARTHGEKMKPGDHAALWEKYLSSNKIKPKSK
jgi:hypothetical protein